MTIREYKLTAIEIQALPFFTPAAKRLEGHPFIRQRLADVGFDLAQPIAWRESGWDGAIVFWQECPDA